MIAYKFSINSDGSLVCLKSDKTLTKYTKEEAIDKLKHTKDFSFYTFKTSTKNISNDKLIQSLTFISNNHIVVYEDICKFQTTDSITFKDELKELINIVRLNNINKARSKELKKKKLLFTLKNAKLKLNAIQIAAIISISSLFSYENVSAHQEKVLLEKQEEFEHSLSNYYYYAISTQLERYIEEENKEEIISDDMINQANEITLENLKLEEEEKVRKYQEEKSKISDEELELLENINNYEGSTLDSYKGYVSKGPSGGKETYYDADCISESGMNGVVKIMRELGYDEEEYPYYIREDGVRMLGKYIMVAANLDTYPRGTLIETSLGIGIVCDACESAYENIYQLDVAVNWTKKLWK